MSKQQGLPVLVGKDSVLHPDGSRTTTRVYSHENNVCTVWEFKPKSTLPGGFWIGLFLVFAAVAAAMFLITVPR